MIRFICISVFILLICDLSCGQVNKTVKLIGGSRYLGDNFKKVKVIAAFDARNTFVGELPSKIGGIKIGVQVNRVHTMGLGIYSMNKALSVKEIPNNFDNIYSGNISFSYLSIFYERVLYFNKKWEWSGAGHFGAGGIKISYVKEKGGEEFHTDDVFTKPMELSTSGYYNFTYWLSAGAGVGYRIMRATPKEYRPYFNGPIYLIKVKVKMIKIVRAIYNKDVKNEY